MAIESVELLSISIASATGKCIIAESREDLKPQIKR